VGVHTNHQPDHLALVRDDLDRNRVLAGAGGESKGHSFIGYFLLSLLFFPLALILAYLSADRTTPLASYTAAAPVSPP
jgi:hypothetical protein